MQWSKKKNDHFLQFWRYSKTLMKLRYVRWAFKQKNTQLFRNFLHKIFEMYWWREFIFPLNLHSGPWQIHQNSNPKKDFSGMLLQFPKNFWYTIFQNTLIFALLPEKKRITHYLLRKGTKRCGRYNSYYIQNTRQQCMSFACW